MNGTVDFERLSDSWLRWARLAGLSNVRNLDAREDGEFRFTSDDHSFHVRHEEGCWAIDTVDDRGQLRPAYAKFSTFPLVEKFLIWDWASAARGAMHLPTLSPHFYALGMNSNIQATALQAGIYRLQSPEGLAVLMEPSATIFSHIISRPLSEIEELVSHGL